MKNQLVRKLALVAAAFAVACASGTQVTEEQVVEAREEGSLEDLFQRVSAELAAEGATPQPSTVAMKARIGGILGEQTATELEAELEEARREDGLVPLGAVADVRLRVPEVEHYDAERATRLSERLDQETERTDEAVMAIFQSRSSLPPEEVAEKIARTSEALALVAPGSDRAIALASEREGFVTQLSQEVDAAIESEDYEQAERMARIAKEYDPENESVQEQIDTIDSKLFEQSFWKKLEQGDPNGAYTMLHEASSAENFDAIRPRLSPYADNMADAFVEIAAGSSEAGNLPGAYTGFHQARSIRSLLGGKDLRQKPSEASFVEVIKKRYWEARKQERPGLAWGFLSVVVELEPSSPSLRRMVRETREQVEQVAVKRLAALPFQEKGSGAGPEFGDAVSSKVIQYLFEQIPQDIRIIEREQLEDIQREGKLGGAGGQVLASADYIVQGDILEAKVDSTVKAGKKTMRVITGTVTEQNEAYLKWLTLDSDDRDEIRKPDETITREEREDVSVEMTLHRKVGVFSVSYRVVDAANAKVVHTGSAHEKDEHEDTSTEGVELGEFVMEFKLASLPSDLEILQQLTDKISAQIGSDIAEFLEEPELRYDEAGKRYVDEGNYARASESLAYAHVLAKRKGKDVEDISARLREAAVRSIERVGTTG